MFNRSIAMVTVLILYAVLAVSPLQAQSPQITNGLSYLTSSQSQDGTWGADSTLVETTYATVSAIEALKLLNQNSSTGYTNATVWLQGQSPQSVDYIAQRIYALSLTDNSINSLIPLLALPKYAWGGDEGFVVNNLDTASSLQALKAANYTDQTLIFGAINYLLSTQNSDGGWGFTQDDDSNVFVTAQVLSALAQFKSVYIMDQQLAKAAALLCSAQNGDGGFGTGPSTVYETALAFIALMDSGQGQLLTLQNALNYVTGTQLADGSWNEDPYSTALALRALAYVKPDLTVAAADIAVTPAAPRAGDSVTVTVTVHNTGLEAVANVAVRLLDNGIVVSDQIIPAIAPGAAVPVTFAIAQLTPTGEHILTATIDPAAAIDEVSKANNSATLRIWVKALADLVVMPGSLSFVPAAPKPGDTVTATANIANMGESDAGPFTADLYDGDPAGGGTKLGSLSFSGIPAGQWGSATLTFTLATAGAHSIYLAADPQNAIPEQNKANNSTSANLVIGGTAGLADLTVPLGGVQISPARPRNGDATTVTILARNLGSAAAMASLELFDGLPNSGGVSLHQENITLNTGESRTISVPWTATPGIHTLYAVIDRANLVAEADKSNNSRTFTVMTDMVDIEVSASDIDIAPEYPMAGDAATVKVVVHNRGIVPSGPFNVTLYNGDPASGGTVLQTFAVSGLAGDATQEIDYPFTAARGTYRFYAVCDPENRVVESDEGNNFAIRSLLVKSSSEAKGPDLVPLEFDLSGTATDPESLRISGMAKVRFQNKGDDKVTTPFRIMVFEDLDGDGLYTEGTDLALGYWDYSSPMNPNMAGQVSVNLSGTLIFRDAPIYAMLDSGQVVFEQNKDNNTIRKGSACENRPANPIQLTRKWEWRHGTTCPDLQIPPPVVIPLIDTNGDGKVDENDIPSILVVAQNPSITCAAYGSGLLKALNGKTGAEIFSASDAGHPFHTGTKIAAGDINNDGKPEILLQSSYVGMLNYDNNGHLLWDNVASTQQWANSHDYYRVDCAQNRVAKIADIDGSGHPVIVSGATVISADGSIRSARYAGWGTGAGDGLVDSMGATVVADLDMDGKQEIVAGNAAYNADGTVKWFNAAIADGAAAIANFDDGPYPEIVVASQMNGFKLYLLDHNGSIKWGPVDVASWEGWYPYLYGSVPTIADFDGDGQLEIGITGYSNYFIIDRNGRLKRMLNLSGASLDDSYPAATVFDLNSDGRPEVIIYSDQYLRIFDGKTGSLLYTERAGQITNNYYHYVGNYYQSVIVADVDGDGHAELVVAGQDYTVNAYNAVHWIKVYGARNNDWQSTRGVWNQASYHVTNVNDDGSIPQYEAPSWLTNNTYHCNVPTSSGPNPYLAADISASYVRVDMSDYPSSVAVTARIGNGGAKAVAAGLKTAFYDGDPASGGTLIGIVTTTKALNPGDYEDLTLTWNAPAQGNHTVYVVADPDNTVAECDRSNNVVSLPVYVTSGVPDPAVIAADVVLPSSIPEGSLTGVSVTVRNLGTMAAANVPVRLFAGNPASGGKQIGAEQTITALPAGGAATVSFTWNTLGSQGTTYLYALVDPNNTTTDTNRGNNSAIKQVQVNQAIKPDLQIAAGDIAVVPATPTEGDTLTVTATVHNLGVAAGNIKAALYNGNPAGGGSLLATAVIPQAIPQGGSAQASFTVSTIGLTGSVTMFVRIDPDNLIDESDKTNNQASRAIFISAAGLSLAVSSDKTSYGANENLQARITLSDTSGQPRELACDLLLLDKNGVAAATAASGVPVPLAANSTATITATWNTGITLSGPYSLSALIKENGRTVARSTAAIAILPDMRIDAKVVTDKISYNPNETATITATITSLGVNTVLENLSSAVTVKDGQGTTLFTATKGITTLTPGAAFTFKSYWNTGTFAPGSYPVTVEVKDLSGTLLASGSVTLTISSTAKPSTALKGQISVDRQSVLAGDQVNISCSVTNTGNADLPDVALSLLTVHVVNQNIYDTLTYQATLPMGATYTNNGTIDTTTYCAKDYLVVLRANIAGVEETIAGSYFRVEGAPSAPALSAPASGSDVETFTPALVVSNAADPNDDKLTYEFELYADTGLTSLIATSGPIPETSGTTAWTVPVTLSENQTYYWRARAHDGKLYGPWMAPVSFRVNTINDLPTAPTIASPLDGSSVAVFTPTLTVNNSSDPDSAKLTYNFQVATDPEFAQIVADTSGVAGGTDTTSWTVSTPLQENTWYYWRAQADDWLAEGPWSTPVKFFVNTANEKPSTPVITAPANGSTVASLATDVTVANSTDPDSPAITYFFEADTAPTFDSANIIRSGQVTEGSGSTLWHLGSLSDNTIYYLRARANDGTADSDWSTPATSFFANTANDPPTTPILANPSDGAGVNVSTPTLSVQNAADPDRDILTYEFEVYADAAMTSLVAHAEGVAETARITSWTVPVELTENQTYYWRARAFDGSLRSPSWMAAASFMINKANDAPEAPVLVSPADGSTIATLTPTLAVLNAVDPDSDNLTYEYAVYQGGVLVASIANVPENSTGTTSVTLATSLPDNTEYQWQARAYDGDRYGPWTDMATFTVHVSQNKITADIDFEPETLNQKSCGKWVLVNIGLPHGYRARDVDIASIRLEGTVPAEPWPYECHDHHCGHGCDLDRREHNHEVLMVKFRRSDVIAVLPEGCHVPVHVTGMVGSTPFEGVDIIRVIK